MLRATIKRISLYMLVAAAISAQPLVHAKSSAGELEITHSDGSQQSALLLATHISGDVNAMVASITVRQNFKNNSDQWVNGRYVFPLPEGAAVDSLKITVGERIIDGVIKEKTEAKKIFDHAKKAGKKAGLLEQHRPNLFSISVANIAPHEEVITNITFIDRVHYENDTFSLRLPTTITPRYIPGAPIKSILQAQLELEQQFEESSHEQNIEQFGWAANTDSVSDASAITPPQTHATDGETPNLFSLALSINAGLDLHTVSSQTHNITTHFMTDKEVDINLANSLESMNRDLLITWQPNVGQAPKAALFQQQMGGDYYSMLMLVPPEANSSISLPRDVTFIIDSSGSMAGESMRQAQRSLHQGLAHLSANDRFNIVDFDSSYRPLFKQSQAANTNNLQQARLMIDQLNADGGTEMLGALSFALSQTAAHEKNEYLRQVIFITDGAIGNESELFSLLKTKLGDARLFTVGIGSAPNTYFMNKAAKYGRGSYTYINDTQQVSQKMAALFKRITSPVMKNLQIDWNQSGYEQYPEKLSDLYAGEPLNVVVKSNKPIIKATIDGKMLNTAWQQKVKRGKSKYSDTDDLDTIWARQKVASLMDQLATQEIPLEKAKAKIVKLGLAHHIVTKFTSFVAVEQAVSKPKGVKAQQKNVANLMPKGSTMVAPSTATPATLFTMLGSLLIVLSSALRRRKLKLALKSAG